MHSSDNRISRVLFALVLSIVLATFATANAAVTTYTATLTGPAESPPNASPGLGTCTVEVDPVAHTMRVVVSFAGLLGNCSACHIHAPTAVAGTGTVGVATQTPSFIGFPHGGTSGNYDHTYDMTQTTSFNAPFLTANGGTPASAETALYNYIAQGRAYLNVHSNLYPGGEIRGFLTPAPVPTEPSTWGKVKSLYR